MTIKALAEIVPEYLRIVEESRSRSTWKTYKQAMDVFEEEVGRASLLTTETFIDYLRKTKDMNPSTQKIFLSGIMGLYLYASDVQDVNVAALMQAKRRYVKRQGKRLPTFDKEAIDQVIEHCNTIRNDLIELRDRAFVLTLADTGLRISEACGLLRGDMDWNNQRLFVIGKGDKQALVRFSHRSIQALEEYLAARAQLDGATGKPLNSLPLFARHDLGSGKKVKPVHASGMWRAIKERVQEAGVEKKRIRLHDFRHYFVTIFLQKTRNLKAAQVAARHEDSKTTGRYAHMADDEMDDLYEKVFNAA